jgi:hypothetical protein
MRLFWCQCVSAQALAYLVLAAQQNKWTPLSHFCRGAQGSGVGGKGGGGGVDAVSGRLLSEADTRQLLLMLESEDLIHQKNVSSVIQFEV